MMTGVAAESMGAGPSRWYECPDRDQLFLLAPCMREWVPAGHLAWFLITIVERMDTRGLHRRPGGCPGRRPYLPEMMLALLLYAYCLGIRSSRLIESQCHTDAAFRVICGGLLPDHSTIARFVVDHEQALRDLFVEGLKLCALEGLCDLSVVALDGTKIAANASIQRNRDAGWIRAQIAKLMAVTAGDEASRTPGMDALAGLEPAGENAPVSGQIARLQTALEALETEQATATATAAAQRAERLATAQAAARAAAAQGRKPPGTQRRKDPLVELAIAETALAVELDRDQARKVERARKEAVARAEGRPMRGPAPRLHRDLKRAQARLDRATAAAEAAEAAEAGTPSRKVNITDPDSRIMNTKNGFIQGYNCQAIVNDQIVLAIDASQDTGDVKLLEPMNDTLATTLANAGISAQVGLQIADAGYCSEHNLTCPGPDRLIATQNSHKQRATTHENGHTQGPPPPGLTPIQEMEHLLRTPQGTAAYKLRSQMIERVFGDRKHNRHIRHFRRRGLSAVHSEWAFINLAGNLLTLYKHHHTTATA